MEFWTEERILNDIKSYISLPEIRKLNSKLHSAICKHKLTEKVYEILGRTGNRFNKCIYSYEFPDNYVYVGLTYNLNERQKTRNKNLKDSVTEHIVLTGLQPIRKQLTDYIPVDDAILMEDKILKNYIEFGWIKLNKVKTGGIGGDVIKWDKEACRLEALKYNTKVGFHKNSPTADVISRKNGWFNEICSHMIPLVKLKGYWSKKKCEEVAKEFNNMVELSKKYPSCYLKMKTNGWTEELTKHMVESNKRPMKYWNYETCLSAALTCKNRHEFQTKYNGGYKHARKHKLLDEIYNACEEKSINFRKR